MTETKSIGKCFKLVDKNCDIAYIFSEKLLNISSRNPIVRNRSKLVHSLITSYNLLQHLEVIPSEQSSYSDLRVFHSEDYCSILRQFADKMNDSNDESIESENELTELTVDESLSQYGLGFDCPVWYGLYDYCKEVAGSTLTACKEIIKGRKIVINWFGGWHHAQKDAAAGYCYVNDIVLGILKLRKHFGKILYIDLDVHYGDGVANAFESTKKVLTLSFHQYEPGFYPCSGNVDECGFGNAKGYSINFPYKSGFKGELFKTYSMKLIERIFELFQPNVIVVQCGGDCMAGDPSGNSNLKPQDLELFIRKILKQGRPTLFLGGGGYNFSNTSRYWTYLTSLICGRNLSEDIPDDDEFFLEYSPGYELAMQASNVKDFNTVEYLDEILCKINEQLSHLHQI